MTTRLLSLLMLCWIALAQPLAAQPSDLDILQQRDARLFATGWRLASTNAPYCRKTVAATGILLHDAATYGRPDAVRAALGLMGDIGILAVAPGSPADSAGLAPNLTLLALGDLDIAAFPRSDPSWKRLTELQDSIDLRLRASLPVRGKWARADGSPISVELTPVPVCLSRFEVQDSGKRALAEGTRVILGRDFPGFAYAEDEFAAAVAHELAHNLLGHRALLDEEGRGQSLVRLTERDADRLMPWLLYNAGYDPRAAIRFMERWGPRHGGGLLRKRTHDGWDERVEIIAGEIAVMEAVVARDGAADWSRHFRAEATD